VAVDQSQDVNAQTLVDDVEVSGREGSDDPAKRCDVVRLRGDL